MFVEYWLALAIAFAPNSPTEGHLLMQSFPGKIVCEATRKQLVTAVPEVKNNLTCIAFKYERIPI